MMEIPREHNALNDTSQIHGHMDLENRRNHRTKFAKLGTQARLHRVVFICRALTKRKTNLLVDQQ